MQAVAANYLWRWTKIFW